MTDAPSLTDFLLARIEEDEAAARAARYDDRDRLGQPHTIACGYRMTDLSVDPDCICQWPARVLAECAAHRRIVELHACDTIGQTWHKCTTCADWEDADHDGPPYIDYPCPTLRAAASIYAGHPDWREEWR